MHRALRPPAFPSAVVFLATALGGILLWPAAVPAATVRRTPQFGTSKPDDAQRTPLHPSHGVFVIGQRSGVAPGQTNYGMSDAYLRPCDPSGAVVWPRQFGSTERDTPKGVTLDDAGNIYVV